MRPIASLVALVYLSVLVAACEHKAPLSSTASAPIAATDTALPQAVLPPAEPAYAGTYAVQDTMVCRLSITITKQADGYHFTSGTMQGRVEVAQQGAETYLTFAGLKGSEPKIDVEVVWQDGTLLLQNYGNSMNEYTRFEQCDAKYLELIRQAQ